MKEKKVWLITGSSSGLGRGLAEEALAEGYRVVATARKPEALQSLVDNYPSAARAVKLDVTDLNDVDAAITEAIQEFGRIDVLVNNAGYGLVGAVEEPSDQQIRQEFETNVFGVINVLRGVLPIMRRHRGGHILNISSYMGFMALPSYGYYSATKYAIQGLSEALAQEVAMHGVRVTIAEPGGIKSDFIERGLGRPENALPEIYPSTTEFLNLLGKVDVSRLSDPRSIAKLLIEVVESDDPPLHLPIGEDAYALITGRLDQLKEEILRSQEEWNRLKS
jgi:NAD(P)-dependent dehydrogenase (short-subunit alcohol dehydrogenase family)